MSAPSATATGPFRPTDAGRRAGRFAWLYGPAMRARLAVAGLFAALAVAWLWPLPQVLDTELLDAPYGWDAKLNAYLIADGSERMRSLEDPYQLDIFHPHADARTWSGNLFGYSIAAIPLGGLSPIGQHNALLLLGLALSGLATWELFRWRGASAGAALIGALVFTFAPFRFMHLGRIQLSVTVALPLLFLAFEHASREPRVRRYAVVALLWVLQLSLGMYYAVHAALMLCVMHWVLLASAPRRWRRLLAPIPAALVVGLGLLALAPYVDAHEAMGFSRGDSEVEATSGRLRDLVTALDAQWLWGGLQEPLDPLTGREPAYFTGAVGPALALLGLLVLAWRARRPADDAEGTPARWWVPAHVAALAMCALFFLGIGPDAPTIDGASPYGWLREHVPGLAGMRYSGRVLVPAWLLVGGFAATAVDALGSAAARKTESRPRLALALPPVIVLLLAGLVVVDGWPEPASTSRPPVDRDLYESIAADPTAHAVLHLPHHGRAHDAERMDYDLAAAIAQRPTVNGASGFDPPLTDVIRDSIGAFPNALSHDAMIELGVDRLVVHPPHLHQLERARVPWLRELERTDDAAVFAVADVDPARADALRRAVRRFEIGPEAPGRAIDRSLLSLTAHRRAHELPNLLDGDPTTRWTTGRTQRRGEVWFTIELAEPRCVQAIWMDYREAPRDLPRGLRVRTRATADDPYETVIEHPVYFPVGALLAAPERAVDRVELPPREVHALTVATPGASRARWGSVYELHLEACDR